MTVKRDMTIEERAKFIELFAIGASYKEMKVKLGKNVAAHRYKNSFLKTIGKQVREGKVIRMSRKFIKYNDVENSYHTKTIAEINQQGFTNEKYEYCVLEKVHGANFQVCITKDQILYGKRTAFVGSGGSFYNWEEVVPKYEASFKYLFDLVVKEDSNINQVTIYGELFGGDYPDQPKSKHKKVQKEILYHQEEQILFYDIRASVVDVENSVLGEKRKLDSTGFLDYTTCIEMFETTKLPYIKVLFTGTFEECLNYDNEFQTTIPSYYGLPDVEGNTCEGIVIKPYRDEFVLRTGSRVILKKKNDKFSENKGVIRDKKAPVNKEFSDELVKIFNSVEPYINENRFNAVFSKDTYEKKDFSRFITDYVDDVIKDVTKDGLMPDTYLADDIKVVRKYIGGLSINMIRKLYFARV